MAKQASVANAVALLAAGVGVGWLVGLSVHPVIEGTITSLLALTTTLAAIAGGTQPPTQAAAEPKRRLASVRPIPVAALVVGIAFGATIGAYARANEWLGPNLGAFVDKWKGTMVEPPELQRRLLDTVYPDSEHAAAAAGSAATSEERHSTGLFAAEGLDDCHTMADAIDAGRFEQTVRAHASPQNFAIVSAATRSFADTGSYLAAVRAICPAGALP